VVTLVAGYCRHVMNGYCRRFLSTLERPSGALVINSFEFLMSLAWRWWPFPLLHEMCIIN